MRQRSKSRRNLKDYYRKPTKKELEEHNIDESYNTEKWNPDVEPLFFCRFVFSYSSIGKYICLWTLEQKDKNSLEYKIAERLSTTLSSFEVRVISTSCLMLHDMNEKEVEITEGFVLSAERITARLQQLLDVCNNIARIVEKSGNLDTAAATDILLRTVLDKYNHIYTVLSIMDNINIWIRRFDANVNTIVIKYLKDK